MIRGVLADGEPVVRFGVKAVLSTAADIEVVAEAETGSQAVDLVTRHRPDVAVLVLTTFADDAYISRALGEGAAGFVLKTGDPQEIIVGVRAVATGAAFLSPLVANVLSISSRTRIRGRAATRRVQVLTMREREVLGLVGAGLSNAEIAAQLHIVEGTVKVYVSTILGQLGVRNRVQAAIIAYESGLIPS